MKKGKKVGLRKRTIRILTEDEGMKERGEV
jgi:hypothetical protein